MNRGRVLGWAKRLPLLFPVVLYVGVVAHWKTLAPVFGDEPHYLIIADSILRDADLQVVNNYDLEDRQRAFIGPTERHSQHFEYSVHNPALAFLIAPAFALGGAMGAKYLLALLCGLFPVLFFAIGRKRLGEGRSVLVAVALGCSMPFLTGAGQIFPDLPSGLLLLSLITLLGEGLDGARTTLRAVVFNVGLALLPWVHMKLSAPMVVLLLGWAISNWRAGTSLRDRTRLVWPAVLPMISTVALLLYNRHAFHEWEGPYAPNSQTHEPLQALMIFLGLLFDQAQGQFFQNPLLWPAFFGVPLLIRQRPRFALLLGALFFSLTVPNAMHSNWFGGYCFAGRFSWSSIALWVFPLIAALERVLVGRWWPLVPWAVTGLTFQFVLSRVWFDAPGRLYAWGLAPAARRPVLLEPLRFVLPTFGAFDEYLHAPATWAAIGLAVMLVVLGAFMSQPKTSAAH